MTAVYIQNQGVTVTRAGRRLLFRHEEQTLAEIQVVRMGSLHLFGGINLTTPALGLLLGQGVDVAFYRRDGRLKGRLVGPLSGNSRLRLAQAQLHGNEAWRLARGREIVAAKAEAARDLLVKYERKKGVVQRGRTRDKLAEFAEKARRASSLEETLGLEGAAARLWFDLFPLFMPRGFSWRGRSRRPPTDPTNALLSLSYSLLTVQLTGAIDGCGLDPYLGCLHGVRHGQPSLALDLLEPFRILLADRFVIRSVNLGVFSRDHFQGGRERGVFLTLDGRSKFFTAWDSFLEKNRWRDQMFNSITKYRKLVETGRSDFSGDEVPCCSIPEGRPHEASPQETDNLVVAEESCISC